MKLTTFPTRFPRDNGIDLFLCVVSYNRRRYKHISQYNGGYKRSMAPSMSSSSTHCAMWRLELSLAMSLSIQKNLHCRCPSFVVLKGDLVAFRSTTSTLVSLDSWEVSFIRSYRIWGGVNWRYQWVQAYQGNLAHQIIVRIVWASQCRRDLFQSQWIRG